MRCIRASALPLLLVLSACAALPPDRGAAEVNALLQDRGGLPEVRLGDNAVSIAASVDALLARELSEHDAVAVALLNNPELQIAYARLGAAAADVYDAARLSNPRFTLAVLDSSARGAAHQITAGLMHNFAEILLLKPRERLAVADAEHTKFAVAAELFDLAQDVRSAYFEVLAANQTAELRAMGATAIAASAALAARDFAAGSINHVELGLAEMAVTDAELAAALARSEATARRIDLGRLLGFTSDRHWRVADGLPLPVAAEDDLSGLRQIAASDSLELKAAASAAANAESALALSTRYPYLATFEAGVTYERDVDDSRLLGPAAAVELPLFNRGRGRLLRAEATFEQRRTTLASLEIALENALTLAHAELLATRERTDLYARRFIPSHQAQVARVHELQRVVALSPLELVRAQNAEFDAYAQYIAAVRDYWRARVALCRAVGSALPSDHLRQSGRLNLATLVVPAPMRGAGGASARDRKTTVEEEEE